MPQHLSKKILILSVSAGAGHLRAAQAIEAYAGQERAGGNGPLATARHIDVMDFVTPAFRKLYTDFYIKLVNKAPALWGYLYHATHEAPKDGSMQRVRRAIERLNTRALMAQIAAFAPDAIICTHFLPAELLSRALREHQLDCHVWVQVTDFDLHRMWVLDHMQGYFAATDEVAFRMRHEGIAFDRIHVTGIPIMPAFAQALDRTQCAQAFGLDPQRKTILLMGGGAGLGSLDTIAAGLMRLEGDFQLIVLAGKNAAALEKLTALTAQYPGRLLAQGFTSEVERLMACADLVITKPGGLTTSECLALGLPMIVNSPIPGQEERNADFLLEQGVALKALDGASLEYRVRHLLDHPEQLQVMRERALALGRPRAALEVLGQVLGTPA
ncbi:glycosyltransferase [Janthinobacterium sp. PC23-8]|uniref:MGDG synthase family glycosyltransferase n=1 Tax=Janthinobacterium sp. PC23-8 TaxID=2012679 RepID=UPI000B974F79|nr:glycosyltransferase [Janthinobacterium sp. PC23-8]OYO31831.1 galactosyldiacylglycerol synthase [Janthinobacterium sp. PC23-8]